MLWQFWLYWQYRQYRQSIFAKAWSKLERYSYKAIAKAIAEPYTLGQFWQCWQAESILGKGGG